MHNLLLASLLALASSTLASPHIHSKRELHKHVARGINRPRHNFTNDRPKVKKRCLPRPTSAAPEIPSSTAISPPGATAGPSQSVDTPPESPESSSNPPEPSSTSTPPSSSIWKLKNKSSGSSFFDEWAFWAFPDPTSGLVDYQTRDDAFGSGLTYVNDQGNAIIKVDTTQTVTGNRKSVRLHHNAVFNGGLLVLDAVHMPTGCATWPAFWSNGPDWPLKGEIDIIEGVNDRDYNLLSVHTDHGCTIPEPLLSLSTLQGGPNCASEETGNGGCAQIDRTKNNYGAGFNSQNGGVYAMAWDTQGIRVWFFARGAIPVDIDAEVPDPESWGTPNAYWPNTTCDPFKFFKDHFAIINTTLCGTWASPAWTEGCKASTGFETCEAFVRANGDKFGDAYWEIKSFKLYQQDS